jgi:light-regulated signal transduction histidine kinase (bacteriophytochrome)
VCLQALRFVYIYETRQLIIPEASQIEALTGELDALSYSISHDLGAPIRAISSCARILEELSGNALDDQGRRLLSIMRNESGRAGDMIEGLLHLSALSRRQMRIATVDMTSLAKASVEESFPREARPNAFIEVAPLPVAPGDQALLRLVWDALVSNAVKFSSGNGEPRVTIAGTAAAGEAVYHVEDNGVGFDEGDAERAFGAFQRLHKDDEFPGIGLGLTVVRRIVARHGGRTWANAKRAEGASVSFALPLTNR